MRGGDPIAQTPNSPQPSEQRHRTGGRTAPSRQAQWRKCTAILLLLASSSTLIELSEGQFIYLMLAPVLLAAAYFGLKGGLIAGLGAAVAVGLLPSVQTGPTGVEALLEPSMRMAAYAALGALLGGLFDRVHAQAYRESQRALISTPTNRPNRQALEREISRAIEQRTDAHLVIIRLDTLHDSVSTFGVLADDELLGSICERLEMASDHESHDLFHIGDEHFALLLECTDDQAEATARQAVIAMRRPFVLNATPIHLDACAGMVSFAHEHARNKDSHRLIAKAWVAVARAQHHALDFARSSDLLDHEERRSVMLLGQVQHALDHEQLHLNYQPKIALATGAVTGVEALVRWSHPDEGNIPPGEFVPHAERTALIHELTRWVLRTSLDDLAQLRAAGYVFPVCINVSPRNFLDPDFLDRVLGELNRAALPPDALQLEITEHSIMQNPDTVIPRLREIAEEGIALLVDDFGTGYSSLAYLKQLPVSALKIDKAFVSRMDKDAAGAEVTKASLLLARSFGLTTVAEGVENSVVQGILREMGCDMAQGFDIAVPMPMDELLEWLEEQRV